MSEHSVIIDGVIVSLSADADEEYMQKVASYVNGKISECRSAASYKKLSRDMQSVAIQLNIADDYMKLKDRVAKLEEDLALKDNEIYGLRHDSISLQVQADAAKEEIKTLKDEISRYRKNVVKLESELSDKKK